MRGAKQFYDRVYESREYGTNLDPVAHLCYPALRDFIRRYSLESARCLEIGSGRGVFQDAVRDYVGVDLIHRVTSDYHKPYVAGSATKLPFAAESFDAVWTLCVIEHVPDPERAFHEMLRVLRPGGHLLLFPAWYCRPWAAEGYPVRPYGDFGWRGKIIKASIPIRDNVLFRSAYVFPRRLFRWAVTALQDEPAFAYRKLRPNYDHFWMSDGDAVNSMDPFDAIRWFTRRGHRCVSHRGALSQFTVRTGGLVFEKA